LGRRLLSDSVLRLLYVPYLLELEKAKREIALIDPSFDPHGTGKYEYSIKSVILFFYRKAFNIYHIYPLKNFLH